MERSTRAALVRASLEVGFADLKLGSGIDATTDKNARRVALAYRLLMSVLKDQN